MRVNEFEGKKLDEVLDCDNGFESFPSVQVPDVSKICSFEFQMDERWLALTWYGDHEMPDEVKRKIFNGTDDSNLAVNLETGELGLCRVDHILDDDDRVALYVTRLAEWPDMERPQGDEPLYQVPSEYLEDLPSLAFKKRPYYLSVRPEVLFAFITRWMGYNEFIKHLIVGLDLRPKGYLEIWGDSHRLVQEWAV